MDSRLENIAVNALEHFREGQLFAWIGDEERADREFYSCISIIDSIQGVVHPELSDLRVRAMEVPRRSDIRLSKVYDQGLSTREGDVIIVYSIIPIGSNEAELRARLLNIISENIERLASLLVRENRSAHLNNGFWQWIDVNQRAGFIGTFMLNTKDGTIFAKITAHIFLDEEIAIHIAKMVIHDLLERWK